MMITKEQLDEYFAVRRQADTLFTPIITTAWKIGESLLGTNRGYKLAIGPQVGNSVTFHYHNEYTKKSFHVEAPLTIFLDEAVLEERKNFVTEMIKSLR